MAVIKTMCVVYTQYMNKQTVSHTHAHAHTYTNASQCTARIQTGMRLVVATAARVNITLPVGIFERVSI